MRYLASVTASAGAFMMCHCLVSPSDQLLTTFVGGCLLGIFGPLAVDSWESS